MTPIKPEDRPKVIALISAIVLVFGFGMWNLFGPKGGASAPQPLPTAAVNTTPAAGNTASATPGPRGGMAAAPGPGGVTPAPGPNRPIATVAAGDQPVQLPNLNNNPFHPVVPATQRGTQTDASAPAPVPARKSAPGRAPARARGTQDPVTIAPIPYTMTGSGGTIPGALLYPRMERSMAQGPGYRPSTAYAASPRARSRNTPGLRQSASLPSLSRGGAGMAGMPFSGPRPALVMPGSEIPLELVGVVSGSSSIAMIRSGEQQYFVRVGERVAGYNVARIAGEEVTLRQGSRARILRIGVSAEGAAGRPPAPAAPVAAAPSAPVVAPPPAWLPAARPAGVVQPAPPSAPDPRGGSPIAAADRPLAAPDPPPAGEEAVGTAPASAPAPLPGESTLPAGGAPAPPTDAPVAALPPMPQPEPQPGDSSAP